MENAKITNSRIQPLNEALKLRSWALMRWLCRLQTKALAQTHCCHSAGSPSSHTVFRYLSHACFSEERLLILVLMANLPPPHQRIRKQLAALRYF